MSDGKVICEKAKSGECPYRHILGLNSVGCQESVPHDPRIANRGYGAAWDNASYQTLCNERQYCGGRQIETKCVPVEGKEADNAKK